jgi:hypothetical protein
MTGLEIYIAERRDTPGAWTVEATDPKEGSIEQAIFIGPDAEKRAREYAAWRYNPAPAEFRGLTFLPEFGLWRFLKLFRRSWRAAARHRAHSPGRH